MEITWRVISGEGKGKNGGERYREIGNVIGRSKIEGKETGAQINNLE